MSEDTRPSPTGPAAMVFRRVPLTDLHVDPANVRAHGDANREAIAASLKRFGQAEPLVVQKQTGRIIGGNGRLQAMKQLDWTECDIVEVDVDDLQATALGIALNRTGELAEWDEPNLAKLLEQLREQDALDGVGFSEDDIDALVQQLRDEEAERELTDDGPDEPPVVAVARAGDLWVLGEHRLLCGDSTKLDDVRRVMGSETAALMSTDPPYGVDYASVVESRANQKHSGWDDIAGDAMDDASLSALLKASLGGAGACVAFVWHPSGPRRATFREALECNGWRISQEIIWVKNALVFGRADYQWRHEPCLYAKRDGAPRQEDRTQTTVWEIDKIHGAEHPTQKPVELFAIPMRNHTKPGDVCFEPFSGSGSQIIAAERTSRRCRAIEISAPYVDVAIKRWQKATGKDAVLDGDGRTFAAMSIERAKEPTG